MRWLCVLLLCPLSACMTLYDLPNDVRLVGLKMEDGHNRDSELDLIKLREAHPGFRGAVDRRTATASCGNRTQAR
jgi:hypothetical protein